MTVIGTISLSDWCHCDRTASFTPASPGEVRAYREQLLRYDSDIRLARAELATLQRQVAYYSQNRYTTAFSFTREFLAFDLVAAQEHLRRLQRDKAFLVRQHKRSRCERLCQPKEPHAPSSSQERIGEPQPRVAAVVRSL